MTDTERIRHNYHRMKILKALNEHVGVNEWVDFEELQDVLEKFNLPLLSGQLSFHLRYCEDQGWVELKRGRTEKKVNAILQVKLAAAGLDRVDIGQMPSLEQSQKFPRREK
jgi:hypothetical protein